MNFLKSYLEASQPFQSYFWNGTSNVDGGLGGSMAFKFQGPGNGEPGTQLGSKCFPGYSGIFCSPCPAGFYKSDYSLGNCQQCLNKPESAYYTNLAEVSPICSYQCQTPYESSTTNPDCLNPIELDVQRLGG